MTNPFIEMTRAFRFIFEPCKNIYFEKKVASALDVLNIKNVYLSDTSDETSDVKDGLMYIVGERGTGFDSVMSIVKGSKFYVGIYHIGGTTSNKYVIKMRIPKKKKVLKAFLKSKYGEMFSRELLDEHCTRFIYTDIKTGEKMYSRDFHVLYRSLKMFEQLTSELGIDEDNDLYEQVVDQEFESVINLDEEVFDSTKFILEKV